MHGQSSAEFSFILSLVLVVFLIFVIIYQGQLINLYQSKNSISAMERAYSLAAAINYVYLAGPETTYNFTFQKFENENVTIDNGIVECKKGDVVAQASLLTDEVTTTDSVSGGEIIIRNNGGMVEIE